MAITVAVAAAIVVTGTALAPVVIYIVKHRFAFLGTVIVQDKFRISIEQTVLIENAVFSVYGYSLNYIEFFSVSGKEPGFKVIQGNKSHISET